MNIIIKPVITEKSINEANSKNRYAFIVAKDANKLDVKNAIIKKFDVKVVSVDVINYLGKKVNFGKKRISGQRNAYKKAIVKLAKGSKISIFELK